MALKIVGLKDLRENTDSYISQVKKGASFLVVRKSKPVFRISSPDKTDDLWEEVIAFTKIQRGGVLFDDLLSRL